jgi:hypothetical protein
MAYRGRRLIAAALLAIGGASPATAQALVERVDQVTLDPAMFDAGFGGISGIDYDRRKRRWVLLSDDRSDHAPARFYTVRIERRVSGWRIDKGRRVVLRDAGGATFPKAGTGQAGVDPESIRIAPDGRLVLWTSEGDVQAGFGPALRRSDRRGRLLDTVALPANLVLDPAGKRGIRDNGTLEGMTHTPDGALWLAMEAPLIEDGSPARAGNAPLVRFTRMPPGKATQQFAYRLDAVPLSQHGENADNGVTEILALDDRRMLVLERSGARNADGRFAFHCRLYLADFTLASDVADVDSLKDQAAGIAGKQLLLDFDTLPGDSLGNLEGMAWMPGSRDRILLVNDNNFVAGEPTRLVMLALSPTVTTQKAE